MSALPDPGFFYATEVFASDRPMISRKLIEKALDAVEAPLVDAQVKVIETEAESLLKAVDPFLKSGNLRGIIEASWNASLLLQQPIYSVWADGYEVGAQHMQAEVRGSIPKRERSRFTNNSGTPELFVLSSDVASLLGVFLNLEPGQLVASSAKAAVLNRAIELAGNFGRSQIVDIKSHLIAAITPQVDTGDPISRKELLRRIEKTLSVGRNRAENISRTELTSAYNVGRVQMGKRSELVEAFRLIIINDTRTTEICKSREGLIIPADDTVLLNANTPSLHFRCRTTLSPVLPRVNAMHRQIMQEPGRRAQNRRLVPLMPGWNGGQAEQVTGEAKRVAAERARQETEQKAATERAKQRAEKRAAKRAADDEAKRVAAERARQETERKAAEKSGQADALIIAEFKAQANELRSQKKRLVGEWQAGNITATDVDSGVKALTQQAKARSEELRKTLTKRLTDGSSEPIETRSHGMTNFESLRRARFANLDVYAANFEAGSPSIESIAKMVEDGWFPDELSRHTEAIIFSSQRNKDDSHWESTYNMTNFLSEATGGDGKVVVYNGFVLPHGSAAHEMGHNLAKGRYGRTDPGMSSEFGRLARASIAPSEYGRNSFAEDFAESVRFYVAYENQLLEGASFKNLHPERWQVIDRLMKEADYDG